jgi:hypothetical protein
MTDACIDFCADRGDVTCRWIMPRRGRIEITMTDPASTQGGCCRRVTAPERVSFSLTGSQFFCGPPSR